MAAREVTRLPYRLPPSTRVAWVSDRARAAWLPRLEAVRSALSTLELHSVATGSRTAALQICGPDRLVDLCRRASSLGLAAQPFDRRQFPLHGEPSEQSGYRPDRPFTFAVIVARPQQLTGLDEKLDAPLERANLLGAPGCCAGFLAETCGNGWLDPTWPMALRSGSSRDLVVDLPAHPGANTFLRPLGLYPVFHAPCSFECPETLARARSLLELGHSIDLGQEMNWLEEILSWPTLWSALHGIAEVKNPVLRLVTTTDATGEKIEIRCRSERYPLEGARGIHFPYRDGAGTTPSPASLLQMVR